MRENRSQRESVEGGREEERKIVYEVVNREIRKQVLRLSETATTGALAVDAKLWSVGGERRFPPGYEGGRRRRSEVGGARGGAKVGGKSQRKTEMTA